LNFNSGQDVQTNYGQSYNQTGGSHNIQNMADTIYNNLPPGT